MNRNRYVLLLLCLTLIALLIMYTSCASTSAGRREPVAGSSANIDELLGLVEEDTQKKSEENLGEEDVLRLLGVNENEQAQTANQAPASTDSLQRQLAMLESQKQSTDAEKENLRERIDSQSRSISSLNSKTEKPAGKSAAFKSRSYADRYQEALQTYRNRSFHEAIQLFEILLTTDAGNSLSDNCQYWIGECYYGLGKYPEAIVAFEKVFSFSNSNKDDDAQLKLGLCQLRLDNKQRAKEEFQKLVDNYPTSEYVSVAKRFISQIQ